MVNDPIGDMLAQLKNATMARKRVVDLPYSRLKESVARILVKEGYLQSVEKTGSDPKFRLRLSLLYTGNTPAISDVKRKSKPGLRVYVAKSDIPRVVGGMGVAILSTPMGVMSGSDARRNGVGGELLCVIW